MKGNPVDLAEAVRILNDRHHDGVSDWYWDGGFVSSPDRDYHAFSPFEAIAVAEKYAAEVEKGRRPR
jgi:hypothetical protein